MIRNLKVLGLALVAVFALSAVAASMASAAEFSAESVPVTLTGTTESGVVEKFKTTAGSVECHGEYEGTMATKPTTTVSIAVKGGSYENCTALGFPGSTIHMNGCTYLFHITPATNPPTGSVDIVCPKEKEITVTAISAGTSKCVIHVPPQTDLTTVRYSTIGAGATREITAIAEISGLKYTHTPGTGLGKCTEGSATNGSYEGKATLTGEVDGGTTHIGVFLV